MNEKSHRIETIASAQTGGAQGRIAVPQSGFSAPVDISLWSQAVDEECRDREEERQRLLFQAMDLLAAYFQGKKVESVYLTGSLLKPGYFYPFSDVDIAVAGLQEDYWRVMVELEDLLDRTVDLIELERCRFSEAITKHGKKIV